MLSAERRVHLVFVTEDVSAISTRGASGSLTLAETLDRLLEGTGLTFRYVDALTVSILPDATAAASTAPDRAGETKGRAKLFWNRFRSGRANAAASSAGDGRNGGSGGQTIDEVIVTAARREERLIDVPQSVTVVSASDLARLGAVQFRDFANAVPGLSFSTRGTGNSQIALRGVINGGQGTTVGIYVDEVPYGSAAAFAGASSTALDIGLFDVQQIEVLRGPQGTLYGATALGGLIKYVTKTPDVTRFETAMQTGISSTHRGSTSYNLSGAVNVPIVTDQLAMRVSGFESHDGGYIDNVALGSKDINRSDTYGGRLDLLFAPSERLAIRITGFMQNISRDGTSIADFSLAGKPLFGSLAQSRATAEPFGSEFRLLSNTVNYDFGSVALTSSSSYQTVESSNSYDITRSYGPILEAFYDRHYIAINYTAGPLSTDKFTQEVRLAAEGAGPVEWGIGVFYTEESSDYRERAVLRDLNGQLAPNDLIVASTPSSYDEYAAFGDVTWHLTGKLDVAGGIRIARSNTSFVRHGSGILGAPTPYVESSEDVSTYLSNARYHFSDRAMMYVRYATGYRPGGPNFVFNDPATGAPLAPSTFQPDRLHSYEIGYRGETGQRRLGVDLAGYYIDWSNIQVFQQIGAFPARINVPGGVSIRGAELVLTARPVAGLTAIGTFAHQDGRLSQASAILGAAKGDRLPGVPRNTATLTADYAFTQEGLRPTIGATLRYVSETRSAYSATSYRMPDYTMVDLRTGYSLGAVDVQLYVHNLLDELGQMDSGNDNLEKGVAILQPRTIGITANVRF